MKKYEVAATPKTPQVLFDPKSGEFLLKGRSVHENSDKFFTPLFDLLDTYSNAPAARTVAVFELEYFNTSSAKYVLDIIKKLEEISHGGYVVAVRWVYESGDLDMEEAGRDYADLVEMEFSVEALSA